MSVLVRSRKAQLSGLAGVMLPAFRRPVVMVPLATMPKTFPDTTFTLFVPVVLGRSSVISWKVWMTDETVEA